MMRSLERIKPSTGSDTDFPFKLVSVESVIVVELSEGGLRVSTH
jgi:hypothetical protein